MSFAIANLVNWVYNAVQAIFKTQGISGKDEPFQINLLLYFGGFVFFFYNKNKKENESSQVLKTHYF